MDSPPPSCLSLDLACPDNFSAHAYKLRPRPSTPKICCPTGTSAPISRPSPPTEACCLQTTVQILYSEDLLPHRNFRTFYGPALSYGGLLPHRDPRNTQNPVEDVFSPKKGVFKFNQFYFFPRSPPDPLDGEAMGLWGYSGVSRGRQLDRGANGVSDLLSEILSPYCALSTTFTCNQPC